VPGYLPLEAINLPLNGGVNLSVWTDEDSGVVFVAARTTNAQQGGSGVVIPVPVSTAGVVGAPRVASGDGRSVVVAYIVATREGFELIATSIDTSQLLRL
jgi:hypothetical protein